MLEASASSSDVILAKAEIPSVSTNGHEQRDSRLRGNDGNSALVVPAQNKLVIPAKAGIPSVPINDHEQRDSRLRGNDGNSALVVPAQNKLVIPAKAGIQSAVPVVKPVGFLNILSNRFRQRRSRRVSGLLLAMALAGCASGPAYEREDTELSSQYGQIDSAALATTTASAPDPAFWTQFDDPLLAQLVERTLSDNFDLQVAVSRLDRARALLRGQRLDRFPTVRAQAGASESRVSAADAPGASRDARDGDRYELGIAASWELDLFGRVRQGIAARGADYAASAADVDALRLALTGELARTYLELRGLQTRLTVATDNAANQQQTLKLVTAQLDAGILTDFDLVRARSQLEATLARVPALQGQVARAMHRLAVLTGREPAALLTELSPAKPLPSAPAALAAGTPGDLLRRRPDIAAAELRVQAATSRIGVASADLFPRFTLAGLLGSAALDSGALFERDSESRSIALGIDWSFLDRGRVNANIDAAKADTDGAVAQYRQTVLLALEDVENALVGYGSARQEDTHLTAAAADSERAAELAHIRFDAGAIDLLDVLDAERVKLQAQDQLADARTRSVVALVQLYVALGGGWQQEG